ncbi:MAG: abortive infection protein [Thaumarchaeota archaeon]|nr:abortive infection protein [Nitrososphaerota archaeon]
MRLKGVNYDVGRVLQGHNMRPVYDANVVSRELEIIKDDLHCNAVKIQGLDVDNLATAARDAMSQGLEVWFAPEMFEKSQQETYAYTLRAAAAAERLRQESADLVLSIGTELALFMQGILKGDNLMERIGNLYSFREMIRTGAHNKALDAYLAKTNEAVRKVFHGKVTYASVAKVEKVDWGPFDIVGVDIYRDKFTKNSFGDIVKGYEVYNKPVVITEFGCCTYRGAEERGGMGWDVIDWGKVPPQLKGDYVYDQGVQARDLVDQLRVIDEAGVDGAFVFTFVQPAIETKDPAVLRLLKDIKFDPDIASYSLVRSFADRNGTTYPDMRWEPKESFKALADYYATH